MEVTNLFPGFLLIWYKATPAFKRIPALHPLKLCHEWLIGHRPAEARAKIGDMQLLDNQEVAQLPWREVGELLSGIDSPQVTIGSQLA